MNHKQVVATWAQQLKTEAKGYNVFFVERTIYSYGYHFPLAHITPFEYENQPIILRNITSYSSSTARHQAFVKYETNTDPVIDVSTRTMKKMIDELNFEKHLTEQTRIDAIVEIQARIDYCKLKFTRARSERMREYWNRECIENGKQLMILHSLPKWQNIGRMATV